MDFLSTYINAYKNVKNKYFLKKDTTPNTIEHFEANYLSNRIPQDATIPPVVQNLLTKYNLNINIIDNVINKFELEPNQLNDIEKNNRLNVLNFFLEGYNEMYKKNYNDIFNNPEIAIMNNSTFNLNRQQQIDALNGSFFFMLRIINLLIFEINPNTSCPTVNPLYKPQANDVKNFYMFPLETQFKDNQHINDISYSEYNKIVAFDNNMLVTDIFNVILNFGLPPSQLSQTQITLRIQFLQDLNQGLDVAYNMYHSNVSQAKLENLKSGYALSKRIINLLIQESTLCSTTMIPVSNISSSLTTIPPDTLVTTITPLTMTSKSTKLSQTNIIIIVVIIILLISISLFMMYKK
jgi:hypothetical protein